MDTRKKLREALYFFTELARFENEPEKFDFNMSAFLHAWRGVMDVMLHDFADYFMLGFSREDELRFDNFEEAARRKKCTDGMKFIHWWLGKQAVLRTNPLWGKRNLSTHGGYLGMAVHVYYLSGSGATSGTVYPYFAQSDTAHGSGGAIPVSGHPVIHPDFTSKRLEFVDIPRRNATDVCNDAYHDMERIVGDAEKTFRVGL